MSLIIQIHYIISHKLNFDFFQFFVMIILKCDWVMDKYQNVRKLSLLLVEEQLISLENNITGKTTSMKSLIQNDSKSIQLIKYMKKLKMFQPTFSAAGYFKIDRTLVATTMSIITTLFIVLVQLNLWNFCFVLKEK